MTELRVARTVAATKEGEYEPVAAARQAATAGGRAS